MIATENKINHIVAITNGSDIYFPKKLKAYITSLVFSLAESCKTTIRMPFAENTNSSFDVYKLDEWALEQYATGF